MNVKYNTDDKVFISTCFDKQKIKESNIPVEALFNETIDKIKRNEEMLKIKTSKILHIYDFYRSHTVHNY
jgi:hypothetical protein